MKTTYHVAAETGSCDPTYTRWEEQATCGHNHKTYEAAAKCREKLTRWVCQHGRIAGTRCASCLGGIARGNSTSALWYNATIHNQDGERASGFSDAQLDALDAARLEESRREFA